MPHNPSDRMYYHPESARLKQMYEDWLNLPFPELGKRVDDFMETHYTLASFASRRFGWSDAMSGVRLPLITKELQEAVREAVSNSQNQSDADCLRTYFERMKELEAQLLKCVLLEREGRKGDANAAK